MRITLQKTIARYLILSVTFLSLSNLTKGQNQFLFAGNDAHVPSDLQAAACQGGDRALGNSLYHCGSLIFGRDFFQVVDDQDVGHAFLAVEAQA